MLPLNHYMYIAACCCAFFLLPSMMEQQQSLFSWIPVLLPSSALLLSLSDGGTDGGSSSSSSSSISSFGVQRREDDGEQQQLLRQQTNRTILFVHVGKAGGETIKGVLDAGCQVMRNVRRRNKCLARLPASKLSDTVTGYFHCFKVQPVGMAAEATSYLFNVRHPLDRTVSWYNYVNPNNCVSIEGKVADHDSSPKCGAKSQLRRDPDGFVGQFFQTCFPTVDDWAYALLAAAAASDKTLAHHPRPNKSAAINATTTNTNTSIVVDCAELAKTSLAGRLDWRHVPIAAHLTANYQHYTAQTVTAHPAKEVIVVRMEHIWDDLKALDRQLGGTGDFGAVEGSAYTHGSESYYNSNNSSKHQRLALAGDAAGDAADDDSAAAVLMAVQLLCCALQTELHTYRDLLIRAANLHENDKLETVQAAVERCGWRSWDEMKLTCEKGQTAAA